MMGTLEGLEQGLYELAPCDTASYRVAGDIQLSDNMVLTADGTYLMNISAPILVCRFCGSPFMPTSSGVCVTCGGPPLGWDVKRAVA